MKGFLSFLKYNYKEGVENLSNSELVLLREFLFSRI